MDHKSRTPQQRDFAASLPARDSTAFVRLRLAKMLGSLGVTRVEAICVPQEDAMQATLAFHTENGAHKNLKSLTKDWNPAKGIRPDDRMVESAVLKTVGYMQYADPDPLPYHRPEKLAVDWDMQANRMDIYNDRIDPGTLVLRDAERIMLDLRSGDLLAQARAHTALDRMSGRDPDMDLVLERRELAGRLKALGAGTVAIHLHADHGRSAGIRLTAKPQPGQALMSRDLDRTEGNLRRRLDRFAWRAAWNSGCLEDSGTSVLHWTLDRDIIDVEAINIRDGTPQPPKTCRDAGRQAIRKACPDAPVPELPDAPWVLLRQDMQDDDVPEP